MLKISYGRIRYDKQSYLNAGEVCLFRNAPLLISGNPKAGRAYFQQLEKGNVHFSQKDNGLDRTNVQRHSTILTPAKQKDKRIQLQEVLAECDKTVEQILAELHIQASPQDRFHTLSTDDQQLLHVYRSLHMHQNFLILIYGNWNLYSDNLLARIKALLEEQLLEGCYVILAADSNKLLHYEEEWDILTIPPVNAGHFLDEDVILQRISVSKKQNRLSKGTWLQMIMAACYVLLFALSAVFFSQANHYLDPMLSSYRSVVKRMEDNNQYLMRIRYYDRYAQWSSDAAMFDEKLARIQQLHPDIKLHPYNIGSVIIQVNSDDSVLISDKQAKRIAAPEEDYGEVYGICTYHKTDTNAYYGIAKDSDLQGIYVSDMLQTKMGGNVVGKTLRTTIHIPVYMRQQKIDGVDNYYYSISRKTVMEEPILGILQEGYFNNECSLMMEESLFEQYQNEIRDHFKADPTDTDHINVYFVEEPLDEQGTLFQSSIYMLSINDKEALQQIANEIEQDNSLQVDIENLYAENMGVITILMSNQKEIAQMSHPLLMALTPFILVAYIGYVCLSFINRKRNEENFHPLRSFIIIYISLLGFCIIGTLFLKQIISADKVYEIMNDIDSEYVYLSFQEKPFFIRILLSMVLVDEFRLSAEIVIEYALLAMVASILLWAPYAIYRIVSNRRKGGAAHVPMPKM